MTKEIGPREKQLRELAEARAAARAKPNLLGAVSVDRGQEAREQAPSQEAGSTPAASTNRGSGESRPALQPTERPPSVDRTKAKKPGSLGKPEVAPGPRETKRPVGRPKVEGPRPWDIEGISKRTWHRRQAEKAK